MSDLKSAPRSTTDAAVARFVEDVGVFFASTGLPRSAGRLLGWLLVCEPVHQSAEELATALRASTGGISTNTRLLIRSGFVERIGLPGDRRAYYRVRPDAWSAVLDESAAQLRGLRRIADEGLELLGGEDDDRRDRLEGMRGLFAFMEREFPALVRRYHEEQGD